MTAGQVVTIAAGATAQQIPIANGGSTLVNVGTATITVSTTATFSTLTTWTLDQHAAMPWPIGPLYAKSASNSKILVVNKLLNLSIPKLAITSGTVTVGNITGTVKVTIQGGSLTISGGTLNIGSITDTVTVGGSVTSLQQNGAVYAVGDSQEYLDSKTVGAGNVAVLTIVTKHSYSAIAVASAGGSPVCIKVQDITAPVGTVTWPIFIAPVGPGTPVTTIVPCANAPGDTLRVSIINQTGAVLDAVNKMAVYGLTSNPGVQLRSDGRACPIGSHNFWVTGVTSGITLIPAPTSPLRIMLRDIEVSTTANIGVVNEATGQQVLYVYANRTVQRHWENGLLLGPGHALNLVVGGTGHLGVHGTYDLVV